MSTEEIVQRTRLLDSEIKVAPRAGAGAGAGARSQRGRLRGARRGWRSGRGSSAAPWGQRRGRWEVDAVTRVEKGGGATASPGGGERTLEARGPAEAGEAAPRSPGSFGCR